MGNWKAAQSTEITVNSEFQTSPPELTVVFVSHGSIRMIVEKHRELLQGGRIPVKIVENDVSVRYEVPGDFPEVEVIRPGRNLGYGRAANLVLRTTNSPYVLLLNPDLSAPVGGITRLLEQSKAHAPAAVINAPATRDEDREEGAEPEPVDWVSGCAMLFHVASIRKIGLFDEEIFLYSEDSEICQNVRRAGGSILLHRNLYFPHLEGRSTAVNPALERLRWWHFGWSNCYRMTKHQSTTWWRNPRRKMWGWRLQSMIPRSRAKRLKWRAKADGAAAFLAGQAAFEEDGRPKQSPLNQAPPSE